VVVSQQRRGGAEQVYDETAPFYDALTAHHNYERWLPQLVRVACRHGLRGKRLLDVGCGTGKSFLPLLRAGWNVTGCDISAAMLRRARSKSEGQARLHVADMRELPRYGAFDLVWAIDDAVNYLLGPGELEQALSGMAANLAPEGRILFDVNTLRTYRTFYAETEIYDRSPWRLIWRGQTSPGMAPASEAVAIFEVVSLDDEPPSPTAAVHRQRHFPAEEVLAAMKAAGLECLAVLGQGLDGIPQGPLDEERQTKAIFVGKKRKGR
jgi:SAM-dependent methyltransferase